MSVDDLSNPIPQSPTDNFESDQPSALSNSSAGDDSSDEDLSKTRIADTIPLKHMPSIRPDRCCPSRTPNQDVPSTVTPETFLDRFHKKLPSLVIRRILKCSIAFFISTLFSTIHPLANALGQSPFLVCSGCLFSHPGRTMGAQFDATLTSALGAAVAITYGLAGVAAATAYNVKHPDSNAGVGINCLFLLVGIFAAQMLRQMFPKLHFFSLQFMVVQLFTLTLGVGYTETPLGLSTRFGLSLLIGNFVSLFVNLVFWPETAVDGLGRTLSQTLSDTKEMLDIITKQFFLDSQYEKVPVKTVEELSEKMRQGMTGVNAAYKEAKYEISYAYSCSSDLNPLRHTLARITKHLSILGGSLKNEQGLFRPAQSVLSSDEEESDFEIKSKPKKRPFKFRSSTDYTSQQSSWRHPNTSLTRDMSLRKSALKAAKSYAKDGSYVRPYETNTDTSPNSKDEMPDNMQAMMAHHRVNEKSIRFETPTNPFLGKLTGFPRNSRSIASTVSEEEEEDNHSITGDKRKSVPYSIRSIFSASNSHLSDRHSGKEDDFSDSNQNTASSLRSFINLTRLSGPKQKPPPRSEKTIGADQRNLLSSYLEKLRDPLLSLAVECATVLDCVHDSLNDQLDLPNENNTRKNHRNLWQYILHILKIKSTQKQLADKRKEHVASLCNCAETIRLQILEFDKCEKERMHALYKVNLSKMHGERLDVSIREELFIIFFFIFSLREVAIELEYMADEMKNLQLRTFTNPNREKKKRFYMPHITTQKWRKWFYSNSYQNVQDRGGYSFGYLQSHMPADIHRGNLEDEYRLTQIATNRSNNKENLNEATNLKRVNRVKRHKETENHEENTNLSELESGTSPEEPSIQPPPILRIRYKLWLAIRYIQNYEFKFALKLSLAVGLLTFPAWVSEYRDWFLNIRGQWAALTVIAVMSPTSGGTLSSGLWRLAGTLIGAFTAWAVLEIDGTSGYLISGFSFVLAVPLFYIHFSTSYAKVTIVTLISYMIVSLSQYVAPVPNETVAEMVWLRTTTLIIGLFVALFLNWTVWPFIAREAVRKTLASAIGDIGDYYSYIMGTFLYHDQGLFPTEDEFEEAQKMEHNLEKKLIACNELLQLTDHEPRLKGPFPKEFYKDILVSSHNLLDRMMSLRVCLTKMSPEVKGTVRKMDKYLYRRDMVASILLHFYTLTASLKAKIPLPSFMPSSRVARKRLLNHRQVEDRAEKLLRYRNLTWFAMACTTEEIIEELEHLTDLVRFIVGESKFTLKARRIEKKGKFY
ncbi:hypothetical protein HPULCUR_006636 [Helicostylum pulchrum]|uniref:Putative ER transporter 6TM N-terminal domain-containing protein n=1 Tax=Helicostylum pulchrum TaxID=562976 RepID=A0ABP9Y2F9_9FUNG